MYQEKPMTVCETMDKYGCENIDTITLLTTLIGNKDKAQKLFSNIASTVNTKHDFLLNLKTKSFQDIKFAGNLTDKETTRIMAAVEFGKRFATHTEPDVHIKNPYDAFKAIEKYLKYENHEIFLVALLNTKNRITRVVKVAEGSLSSTVVHPREILSHAIVNHAAAIIIAHNHPSGSPNPSTEDDLITEKIKEACEIIGIGFLDHIVIGNGIYYSYKEHNK